MEFLIAFVVFSFLLVAFGVRGIVIFAKLVGLAILMLLVWVLVGYPIFRTLKEGGLGLMFILFLLSLTGLGLAWLLGAFRTKGST